MAEKRCAAKRFLIAAVVAYAAIWLACFVLYWTSLLTGALGGGAIAGYTLLVLYILLPTASVISSFLVGCVSDFGWWRLVAPLATCVFYPLFIMATFASAFRRSSDLPTLRIRIFLRSQSVSPLPL